MVFFKVGMDGFKTSADSLLGSYSSAGGSACCILGSGPSVSGKLGKLSKVLRDNQIAPFSINWGGFSQQGGWECYPALWTSYDHNNRFSARIFRDPSVMKFVKNARSHELIASGSYAAFECPNTYFFYSEEKSRANQLGWNGILDSSDSFMQAVDIAIRLGFKRIFLAGCDFFVPVSEVQQQWLKDKFAEHAPDETYIYADPHNSLWAAFTALSKKTGELPSKLIAEFAKQGELSLYSFGNADVVWEKAVMVDHHCYLSAATLASCRKLLDSLGVTVMLLGGFNSPKARLQKFFPEVTLDERAIEEVPDYSKPSLGLVRYPEPFARAKTKPVEEVLNQQQKGPVDV